MATEQVCQPIVAGTAHNSHPTMRKLAGQWLEGKPNWPTHIMLGWSGGSNSFSYSYAAPQADAPAPFTEWSTAAEVDTTGYMDPAVFDGEDLMYPSLLDADSPFELGKGSATGLSYQLVGNNSAYVYIIARRSMVARIPVAFVPWYTQLEPVPFPPQPPSPLNPANCTSFRVAGAGTVAVNGVYNREVEAEGGSSSGQRGGSRSSGGGGGGQGPAEAPACFTKDATHQIYHFGSHWKMGHMGVGPVYYTAADTHGGGTRVPVDSWEGPPPFPTVTCV